MAPYYLAGAVIFNVIANAFLRMGSAVETMSLRKVVLIGAGLFIGFINTLCYIKSLESISLGTAFAVWAAVSIICITGVSAILFGEGVSAQKGAGLAIICVGLILLRGS